MVLDGLTAADLMYECAACNGSGKIYNPVWKRYNAAAIDPARELPLPPMIDTEEPQMPEPPPEPEHINCPNCVGRGQLATDAGRTVLDFVRLFT